jgi:enoyl-CoA hydratase
LDTQDALETLEVEARDGFAIVRLNRPPVNAVNQTMMRELRTCFETLSQDRTVSAVILSARGERAFCAGIDLKQSRGDGAQQPDLRTVIDPHREWRHTQYAIRECLVPVIAAVEAVTIGAGFGMVGVCDLIIAGEAATFGLTEIDVGALGGASKALRLLGPSRTRRMLFLGEMFPAAELHRLGGIEEVVPRGGAEPRAIELAEQLATKSPIGLRLAKESILRIESDDIMQQYRTENDYSSRLARFNDSGEARLAFVEKRPPKWTWT